jgi:ectoine hydroxylase-related dioxygenase (phytanoyl-CoA dioxygenase family)
MKSRLKHSTAGEPATPSLQQQAIDRFRQYGTLWLENVLAPDYVSCLREAYADRYLSLSRATLRKRHAVVGDKRFMVTVKIKPPFNSPALFANPVVMPIVRQLLGSDCTISSFGSVVAMSGAGPQSVHFDYPPLFESESVCASLPPHAITLVVPLLDLNDETGSTAVWEGSHARVGAREQLKRLAKEDSFEGATMPFTNIGDVFLMDFRLIHAGMANRSPIDRPILYIVYRRPWFREDMNFYEQPALQISPKQRRRIPKEHRHLFDPS